MIQPPESFSIRKADANYHPAWREIGKLFEVYLDGVPVTKVIAYDEGDGSVRRLQTDGDGKVIIARPNGEYGDGAHVLEETLHGCFEARWLPTVGDA